MRANNMAAGWPQSGRAALLWCAILVAAFIMCVSAVAASQGAELEWQYSAGTNFYDCDISQDGMFVATGTYNS